MWQYNYNGSPYTRSDELYHYGVKGMKWHKHLKSAIDARDTRIENARTNYDAALANQKAYYNKANAANTARVNAEATAKRAKYAEDSDAARNSAKRYQHEHDSARAAGDAAGARARKYSKVANRKTSSEIKSSAKSILSKIKAKTTIKKKRH